jgi:flagellar basal body P-ring formation protein FlgA
MRLKPARITGQLVETMEVVVPLKTIARGELLTERDVIIERRPRDGQNGDLVSESTAAIGKMARRQLGAGVPLRLSDIQRQEVIARGELVTMSYDGPGVSLSLRGKANEAGAPGDVISITNPTSKRVVQGTVIGPGRVSVNNTGNGTGAGRIAIAP